MLKKIVRTTLKILLPLLVGGTIIWFLYSKLDTDKIWDIICSDINYGWIILTMILGVFSHVFRAYRWRLQLEALGVNASMRTLNNAIFGTYAMNLLLPRLGEVWRCSYVARREKMSFTQALGSVFSDRLADTAMVGLLTVIVFFTQMDIFLSFLKKFPGIEASVTRIVSSPWIYIFLTIIVLVLISIFRFETQNRLVDKVRKVLRNVWFGFRSVLKMRKKYQFIIFTIAIWGCYFLQLYISFFAFSWSSDFGPLIALSLFVMGSISMGIPVQGGLGPWHFAIIGTLAIYGVSENEAGAFALVVHGASMVVTALLGLYTAISISFEKKIDQKNVIVPENKE